ncbi:small-conductance mechanosensitive channel [Conyzicola lurida]|uniref:Small-conductance mechanosensitive channel n=1 Tax=Conyzicola lurida TaxID=1172621 RepID=A0A841AQC4_9MICO|nr:DUF2975 domain-containing protein [Conyzicola lurida]MBB5844152.1 small-conductance mechanosensitive channel [Conyzicola lurida]
MSRLTLPVVLLRIFLVALFAFLLLMQLLSLPGQFVSGDGGGEYAHLGWVLLVAAELGALCLQVVIVCTWKLLTAVKADRIFSESSLGWVNGIVWSFVAGWVLLAGTAAYLVVVIYFSPERDPGIPVLLFGMVLVGAVFVLLVVVLRALLRQATELRADMDIVI